MLVKTLKPVLCGTLFAVAVAFSAQAANSTIDTYGDREDLRYREDTNPMASQVNEPSPSTYNQTPSGDNSYFDDTGNEHLKPKTYDRTEPGYPYPNTNRTVDRY